MIYIEMEDYLKIKLVDIMTKARIEGKEFDPSEHLDRIIKMSKPTQEQYLPKI